MGFKIIMIGLEKTIIKKTIVIIITNLIKIQWYGIHQVDQLVRKTIRLIDLRMKK